MAMTGFDPSIVSQSIGSVINAYGELAECLTTSMKHQFILPMSEKWACNAAQKFFVDAFKPAMDSLMNNSNEVFSSVVSSMNSAAQSWAERTESAYSPVSFMINNGSTDVSSIRENINGVRGIDKEAATSTASNLSIVLESANQALSKAQQAVQNCGFIGGSQASNLNDSLARIKENISRAASDITTQAKTAIDNTVAQYGDLEGKVSQAFSTQN